MMNLLKGKGIVVNLDLDGILSGLLLHHYLDCEVVGFSNSKDTVYMKKGIGIYEPVYIDMYVSDPNVVCLDQHIVSFNEIHNEHIRGFKTKLNPNVERGRNWQDNYFSKYPFGTVHYLIALLESEGVEVDLDLQRNNGNLFLEDVLFRSDDTLNTTLNKYKENAQDWWKWLVERSNHSYMTSYMYKRIYEIPYYEISEKTFECAKMFSHFGCEKKDGGYVYILDDKGHIKKQVQAYIYFLSKFTSLRPFNVSIELEKYEGVNERKTLYEIELEGFMEGKIKGEDVFSYAFVKSKDKSLSFTKIVFP